MSKSYAVLQLLDGHTRPNYCILISPPIYRISTHPLGQTNYRAKWANKLPAAVSPSTIHFQPFFSDGQNQSTKMHQYLNTWILHEPFFFVLCTIFFSLSVFTIFSYLLQCFLFFVVYIFCCATSTLFCNIYGIFFFRRETDGDIKEIMCLKISYWVAIWGGRMLSGGMENRKIAVAVNKSS